VEHVVQGSLGGDEIGPRQEHRGGQRGITEQGELITGPDRVADLNENLVDRPGGFER